MRVEAALVGWGKGRGLGRSGMSQVKVGEKIVRDGGMEGEAGLVGWGEGGGLCRSGMYGHGLVSMMTVNTQRRTMIKILTSI